MGTVLVLLIAGVGDLFDSCGSWQYFSWIHLEQDILYQAGEQEWQIQIVRYDSDKNQDISDIIPVSVPNAVLINSIAQSLGLHDFYTVGLWNYCEGYNGQGTTSCSDPQTLYWFNPVEIIQSQLLAGATSTSAKPPNHEVY